MNYDNINIDKSSIYLRKIFTGSDIKYRVLCTALKDDFFIF